MIFSLLSRFHSNQLFSNLSSHVLSLIIGKSSLQKYGATNYITVKTYTNSYGRWCHIWLTKSCKRPCPLSNFCLAISHDFCLDWFSANLKNISLTLSWAILIFLYLFSNACLQVHHLFNDLHICIKFLPWVILYPAHNEIKLSLPIQVHHK